MYYGVETSSGTRPTLIADYTEITDITDIPGITQSPGTIEITNLGDDHKRYLPGLPDSGGNIEPTANYTDALVTLWVAVIAAYTAGLSSNFATWFYIKIEGAENGFYFSGAPTPMGVNNVALNSAAQVPLPIVLDEIVGWAAIPTAT